MGMEGAKKKKYKGKKKGREYTYIYVRRVVTIKQLEQLCY